MATSKSTTDEDENLLSILLDEEYMEERRNSLKLSQALKEGAIRLGITKCLFQGPPRVGKTHVKCLLLRQQHNDDQSASISTPCAVDPERAIRKVTTEVFHTVDDTKKEDQCWELMDDELLANLISEVAAELDLTLNLLHHISSSSDDDDDYDFEKLTASKHIFLSLQKKITSHSESSAITNNPTATSQPHHRRHDLLYFIDSGGQPQFQEVLQAFIPNTTVLLLAFNLTQKLSEMPLMNYQSDKGLLSLGRYAISNEEIISRFARMVYSSNQNVYIAFLGTHRDLQSQAEHEQISEKNSRLMEIFSFCKEHLLFYDLSSKSLLFPIDGLQAERGEFDDPVVCQLRKAIDSTSNSMQEIEIPLKWYALELALKKHANDHGCQVISMATCIELSKDLEFQEEDVPAALQFLSNYNLILYYPKILESVVFTSPQVLLDKVTELTECVYELSCHNDEPATPQRAPPPRGDYLVMKEEGVISDQILQDFPKYYQPGLFSTEDLMKIFEHLYIISRRANKGSYFMPALLPPFTPDELDHLFNPNNPPLLFEFTEGCAPTGLFCALLVCLTSPSIGWKVAHHLEKAPLHDVRSNAACLTAPGLRFLIIMVDSFNQFEVHYRCTANEEKHGLPQIYLTVTEALEEVIHNRKFNIAFPRKAFYCQATAHESVGSNPPCHIAIPGHKRNQLICSVDPMANCMMTPPITQWLAPLDVSLPLASNNASGSVPTIGRLMKHLKPESPNWYKIGIHLEVPEWKLAAIESQKSDSTDKLIQVFIYWQKNAKEYTNPFTWETIVEVLRDIDNNALADKIEKKFVA